MQYKFEGGYYRHSVLDALRAACGDSVTVLTEPQMEVTVDASTALAHFTTWLATSALALVPLPAVEICVDAIEAKRQWADGYATEQCVWDANRAVQEHLERYRGTLNESEASVFHIVSEATKPSLGAGVALYLLVYEYAHALSKLAACEFSHTVAKAVTSDLYEYDDFEDIKNHAWYAIRDAAFDAAYRMMDSYLENALRQLVATARC